MLATHIRVGEMKSLKILICLLKGHNLLKSDIDYDFVKKYEEDTGRILKECTRCGRAYITWMS